MFVVIDYLSSYLWHWLLDLWSYYNMSDRFVTAVFPSDDDDVITSPYNSVLAMKQLADHADCVLPVENQVF